MNGAKRSGRSSGLAVILGFGIAIALAGCSDPESVMAGAFDYAEKAKGWPRCASQKTGLKGAPAEVKTAGGTRITVKPPSNYQADVAHPLLVLFPPGGGSAEGNERTYEITKMATERGYVVASVDHQRPGPPGVIDMATAPKAVAESWCIDNSRVFATGHSDGGLFSNGVAFLPEARGAFRAISPSAAGIRKQDLKEYSCPKPTPVKVYHGAYDMAFGGWGRGVAEWWAECNKCKGETPVEGQEGCVAFQGCAAGGETIYCEGPWIHSVWHGRVKDVLDFFDRYASR